MSTSIQYKIIHVLITNLNGNEQITMVIDNHVIIIDKNKL